MIEPTDDDTKPDQPADDLLPARMINEWVYCPRLFYLMHVEGQFAESIDTIDGGIIHRRVDSGTGGLAPVEPCAVEPCTVESLSDESFLPAADQDEVLVPPEPKKTKRKKSKHNQPATLFGDEGEDDSSDDQDSSKEDEGEEDQEDQPRTIHARSVTLSSEALGVIAKLDLAEATGDRVVPVDYKRGRPKQMADGTAGAWDPERVQIALQAIVLRDNGYTCDEGVLYFNETRQRVRIPIDDELIALATRAVAQARNLQDHGEIPPPLINSPKCPRCSLVGICLPDETRKLAAPSETLDSVRPMITARDERRPVYFNTQGMWIGRKGDVLQAKADGKVLQEIRFNDINQINLFGNIQLSTQAIQTALGRDIPVVYFTQKGYFYGIGGGLGAKNILVRRQQFRRADHPEFCLSLARQLVHGKILNCRTLLMRNHREPSAESLRGLKRLAQRSLQADSLASLLGIEGSAARVYFGGFSGMLKVDCALSSAAAGEALAETRPAFDFRGRNRRPPRDPVNAMLSLAYSLLTKDCLIAATTASDLDPVSGVLSSGQTGQTSLGP